MGEAPKLAALLAPLPRPLWISVYDGRNIGPEALADWLESWLPKDIGVFFQDGVGVYARTPQVAAHYADVLSAGSAPPASRSSSRRSGPRSAAASAPRRRKN